jgi:hypothetical protein
MAGMMCDSYSDEPATTHINMRSCVWRQPVCDPFVEVTSCVCMGRLKRIRGEAEATTCYGILSNVIIYTGK